MSDEKPTVYVIDRDDATRDGIRAILHTLGVQVETLTSAEEFLAFTAFSGPVCLIIDLDLPGISGLDLLARLKAENIQVPTIVLAEDSDVRTVVSALREGAIDFIEKPFIDRLLVKRVSEALGID